MSMPGTEPAPPQRHDAHAQVRAILGSADHLDRILAEALRDPVPGQGVIGLAPARILCELERAGTARPSHLQEITGLTSGGVTKTLDRLEARGFIRRSARAFPDDRRGVSVELTREGTAVVTALGAAVLARLEGLRAEVEILRGILGPVAGG